MHAIALHLKMALRQLRKHPGFTLTVVLTLALGLGAATAVFSVVEGVLLRPLPYKNAERLVMLGDHVGDGPHVSVTIREIETYAKTARAFRQLGGYITARYELSGGAQDISAARVDAGVFPTLGVSPVIGRFFTQDEERSRQPLALISYGLWSERYHRAPEILGTSLVLDRKAYSIIGVMPRDFEFPIEDGTLNTVRVWVPLSPTIEELSEDNAGFWGYHMIARLNDGVSVAQASQDADRVAKEVMRSFPPSRTAIHIRGDVVPLREFVVSEARPVLRMLFLAVLLVLLIACVNVSALLLVRALRMRREYALRLALGASSANVLQEAVLQGLLLSTAGGALGLLFATAMVRAALRLMPDSLPRMDAISIDTGVAAFALLAALATGVICSLAPAFAALRTSVLQNLKEGTPAAAGGSDHRWLRSLLAVFEVAAAVMLLVVAGAFLRSFQAMLAIDPGFRADHVVVANYQLPLRQYADEASLDSFYKKIVARLQSAPGVLSAGITTSLPATDFAPKAAYTIEGDSADNWKLKFAQFAQIHGDYFAAMGIAVLDGRTFTAHDDANAPLVVIVSESMARQCWPGERAVGKRMHVGNPKGEMPWATIVGVVADTKLGSRDEPTINEWYTPAAQPAMLFGYSFSGRLSDAQGGYVTVRSVLPAEQTAQLLRSAVAEIDPMLALDPVSPMDDVLRGVEAPRRFQTSLVTVFAAGALLLATTGIYAIMAFSVSQRTAEIAVRMALGAQRSGIARLVILSAAKTAMLGCALGSMGAVAASRFIESFLFGVSATDPLVYGGALLLMMATALLASALPAMQAASLDPAEALRKA